MAPSAADLDRRTLAVAVVLVAALLVVLAVWSTGAPTAPAATDDDRHEPNDDFLDATALDRGTHGDLVLAGGDRDVYAVELAANQSATATLRFEHDDGDLDLETYDADARLLDRSDSITDDESLTVAADEPGRHYVLVYGHEGAGNEYELVLESDEPLA